MLFSKGNLFTLCLRLLISRLIACVNVMFDCVSFLNRELHACVRASYRYDVENGTRSLARSLDWSIPVNFFSILGF